MPGTYGWPGWWGYNSWWGGPPLVTTRIFVPVGGFRFGRFRR